MELIENSNLFQTVFDSASNGIAVMRSFHDEQGKVIDFSILLLNKFMLSRIGDMDYKGKRYTEVFPKWSETGILQKFIDIAESGSESGFEECFDLGGIESWFRFTAVEQDHLLVVTVEDISEWKHTETALKNALDSAEKQRRLYDSITNNTPDLVYVFDLDYRFTYANKALLTMWGKSAEDAIGKGLRDNGYEEWHALMHEREIDEVAAFKKTIRGTVSFPHAELGSRVYDYIFGPVINENGEVEAIAGITRDITEIRLAGEKIELSGIRLKSMIDQTPAPTLVLMGDDLVVEQINAPMLQMIGRVEEVVGIPLIVTMPELEGQYVWEEVLKVYREGVSFDESEVPVSHMRNGVMEDFYYNIAYRPLKEDGRITGMIQVAIDVTEQVLSRKKTEESEARFRALINASSDVIYGLNADWTIMYPMDGRGFLLDADAPVRNWMEKNVYPGDREAVKKAIAEAIENKSVFEMEHRVLTVDGSIGWTFSRAIPILDGDGNIVEWFGSASNTTVQKQAQETIKENEEKFRLLSDEMPQFVWTGDAEGNLGYFNKAVYKYSGLSVEETLNGGWIQIVHPDDRDENVRLWQHSIATGEDFSFEHRFRQANGDYNWQLSRAVPQKDNQGVIRQWIGTSTDIQEQKNVKEELEKLVAVRTKELQRSNEDLQQFAHVASHDLKEPVRKIKTFTNRLEDHLDGKLDDAALRYIERIHVASDRMSTMIDGVLKYSTINEGMQKPALVSIGEIIEDIRTDLEVSLQNTGATIHYGELPQLEGARVLLYQLFYNLINNSIKFAKSGVPPEINLSSVTTKDGDTGSAIITLKDNGIGFDQDHAEQIFETFTRLNSKDQYEGTGLGLSLCKKIAERHGGNIVARSRNGEGAEFIITLPLQQSDKNI